MLLQYMLYLTSEDIENIIITKILVLHLAVLTSEISFKLNHIVYSYAWLFVAF